MLKRWSAEAPSKDKLFSCENKPSFSRVTGPIARLGVLIIRKKALSSSGLIIRRK